MPRQSITLSNQNDLWLRDHVEKVGDYANKSELVNDLIRRARRAETINQKLITAEQSGFTKQSSVEILAEFKADLKQLVTKYKVSNDAKEDLRRIYIFGYQTFDEAAADDYYYNFFLTFEKIADNPYHYQSVDHIRSGYKRCICGSDSVFYRITNSKVEIMAILGGQDTDIWL